MINFIFQVEENRWSQLVEESDTASFFSTPECNTFYQSLTFIKPFFFGVEQDNKLVGIMSGYIISEGGRIKQYMSRRAIVPGGLLLSNTCSSEAIQTLLNRTKQELRKQAIYIEIRNYNDYTKYSCAIQSAGFLYQPHLNFHVVTSDVDFALKQLNSTKRRDIKVSRKEGAEVILVENETDLKDYYNLLVHLYKTKVKTPLFPYEFFKQLSRLPEGRIFVVKHQGRVLGGSVCVELPNRVLYEWFVCGLDREIKNVYPSTLATWGAIEYAATHNISRFDMMGAGKPNEGYGVREFKSKFGGELVEYGRFSHVCNPLLFFIGKLGVKFLKSFKK